MRVSLLAIVFTCQTSDQGAIIEAGGGCQAIERWGLRSDPIEIKISSSEIHYNTLQYITIERRELLVATSCWLLYKY